MRENLDSKSITFSILTLCTWTIWRETIEKLNANFWLGCCRRTSDGCGIGRLRRVIWQASAQADTFACEKWAIRHRSRSRLVAERIVKNARSSSARSSLQHCGLELS